MVRLRVLNGTLPDVRLCDTCRWSHIEKYSNGDESVACGMRGDRDVWITKKVVECNDYKNINAKTLKELEELAWILNIKGRTIMGFKPPERVYATTFDKELLNV